MHKCHSIQGRESRDKGYCLLSKAIWRISPDKMLPPERKRTVLEDVGTAYLFYCHLTRDSWTSAFIRRMSQRDWMAFGSTWFFHTWKHSVKLSTPETDTKQLAKASTPESGTKQLAKLSTPEQPIITVCARELPKTRYMTLAASPHTPYWSEPARHP